MQIRALTTIDDCRRVAALEREIWGADADETVPLFVLVVSVKRGGILLGAFDEADTMCGFVYSTPAVKEGRLTQWSHMLGVLPAARSVGVGRRLKLAQRDAAVAMGVELVEWTYDPLQALNAHLNFSTLGVVVEAYEENIYGDSSSPLHGGAPTDRFVAEWHITRPHVARRIAAWDQPVLRDQSVADAVLVNPAVAAGEHLGPGVADLSSAARRLLVEIPVGFSEMLTGDPGLALAWRRHTREIFQRYFGAGYRVVDFFLSTAEGRGHYLLVRAASH